MGCHCLPTGKLDIGVKVFNDYYEYMKQDGDFREMEFIKTKSSKFPRTGN